MKRLLRNPSFWTLLLALALGLTAFGLVWTYLDRATPDEGEPPEAAVKTRPVVVAARELERGTTLQSADLSLIDWPVRARSKGTARSVSARTGRTLVRDVPAGIPVLDAHLAPADRQGLAALIPDTMRAVSVAVDEVTSVSGFVRPGSRVDVMATLERLPSPAPSIVTRTVLENLEVLAVGRQPRKAAGDEAGTFQAPTSRTPTVTLLVTPDQGERLTLADSRGQIRLALRNGALATDSLAPPGATLGDLVPDARPRPTPPPPPAATGPSVEIYNGEQQNAGGNG